MLEEYVREPVTIQLAGEIDTESVTEISSPVFDALTDGVQHVQVDCSEVTFIDSRGLTMMARAQRIAQEQGTLLEWVNPPQRMMEVIHIVGLTEYLTISIDS